MAWTFKVRAKRRAVAARDGWCCHYCRSILTLETSTLDHVIPRAKGGTYNMANLRLACRPCNSRKADKPPHAFMNEMMQGVA